MNIHTAPHALQNAGEKLYRIISIISNSGLINIRSSIALSQVTFEYILDREYHKDVYPGGIRTYAINLEPGTTCTITGDVSMIYFSGAQYYEADFSKNHKLMDLQFSNTDLIYSINLSGNTFLGKLSFSLQGDRSFINHLISASSYSTEKVTTALREQISTNPNGKLTLYGNGKYAKELIETSEEAGWSVERIF